MYVDCWVVGWIVGRWLVVRGGEVVKKRVKGMKMKRVEVWDLRLVVRGM